MPWQRWFLIHALELLPGAAKVFRFRLVLLLVARQNGKTSVLVMLILWRLFTDGAPMIIGAAQNLDVAEETWEKVVEIAEAIPELEQEIAKVSTGNGKRFIRLDTRERYRPQAANRRGGRGWSGDMVLLDELREHQTWDAWAAISKTTNARDRAQVYGVSNAGDASSIVLRHLRKQAIASINGENLSDVDEVDWDEELKQLLEEAVIGIFEWSAREDRGRWDIDGWYEANPALGWTIKQATIASDAGRDPEDVFRTEVLCQFVDTSGLGPFPEGSWEQTRIARVDRDPKMPAGYCVDLSYDRKMAYVALCFYDTDGHLRAEIAAARAGTDWLIPWFSSPDRVIAPDLITLQKNGAPISSMIADFEAAGFDLVPWEGPDLGRASGMAFDRIVSGTVSHGIQPVLDIAANTARTKPAGDGWLIDRKNSSEDAAPLVAWVGSIWLVIAHGDDTTESIYESRGLLTA